MQFYGRALEFAERRASMLASARHHRRYCRSQLNPQLPGDRRTNAHKNADVQFAIWNRNGGISAIPATSGTVARRGPEKRASTIAHTPHRLKKARPLSISRGHGTCSRVAA